MQSNALTLPLIALVLMMSHGTPAVAQDPDESDAILRKRAQIDAYIARVREEETFEELAAGLSEWEPALGVLPIDFSAGCDATIRPSKFESCLANRRVARLFELLSEQEDADALCRGLFEEKLADLKTGFQRHWNSLDGHRRLVRFGLFPAEPMVVIYSGIPQPMSRETLALSAALFLSAEFCPVEEVLRQLDAWIALADVCNETIEQERVTRMFGPRCYTVSAQLLKQTIFPEPRFQLSLLASMYERRFWDDPGGTWHDDAKAVKRAMDAFDERGTPVTEPEGTLLDWAFYHRVIRCAWDAPTTLERPDMYVFWPDNFGEFRVFRESPESEWILPDLRTRLLARAAKKDAKDD